MTIVNVADQVESTHRRKSSNKYPNDEKSPLLPLRRDEIAGEVDSASFAGAVFNLSTTIVGAGIMALPATMKVLGLIPGILMIIFMAFLTEASIEMLLRFSRAGKTDSYGSLMNDAFGNIGRILLQFCVVVNNIGVLVVYMIIIGTIPNQSITYILSLFLAPIIYIVDGYRRCSLWNYIRGSSPFRCFRSLVWCAVVEWKVLYSPRQYSLYILASCLLQTRR